MSAPTYTVTEDKPGWFTVRGEPCTLAPRGVAISSWKDRETAKAQAHSLNVHDHAFAMLALLVESQSLFSDTGHEWFSKRDALIAKITGEPK